MLFRSDGTAYDQATVIFQEAIKAIKHLGGDLKDVVRVRMFVKDGADSDDVGQAMKNAMGDTYPAATMIIGAKFIRAEMKVEIEVDALVYE